MQLALVHDWLNQRGGAEDVLETLVNIYPASPIYTSLYAPDLMPDFYRQWDMHTLWTDHLPGIHSPSSALFARLSAGLGRPRSLTVRRHPQQQERLLSRRAPRLRNPAHLLLPRADPLRLAISTPTSPAKASAKLTDLGLRPLIAAMRRWDFEAAQRVDHFIAISTEIQKRIYAYYWQPSTIIFPPVDTQRFQPSATVEDYYLVVSRLIPYKRIDLAVQAATRLSLPLKVGGKGRDLDRLKEIAGPTVEFLGYVPDADLPDLMARCKAFIFPGLEDFGITPVQAQAAGRPVIAYARRRRARYRHPRQNGRVISRNDRRKPDGGHAEF